MGLMRVMLSALWKADHLEHLWVGPMVTQKVEMSEMLMASHLGHLWAAVTA